MRYTNSRPDPYSLKSTMIKGSRIPIFYRTHRSERKRGLSSTEEK
jgi:hypothetical protein